MIIGQRFKFNVYLCTFPVLITGKHSNKKENAFFPLFLYERTSDQALESLLCFPSHFSCLSFPISHFPFPFSSLPSSFLCLPFFIYHLSSPICRLASLGIYSPFSCRPSPVSPLLSPLSCLPSPVSPLLFPLFNLF